MKIQKRPIALIGFILLLSMLFLTLTSKDKVDVNEPPSYCETFSHDDDYIATINIGFPYNGG